MAYRGRLRLGVIATGALLAVSCGANPLGGRGDVFFPTWRGEGVPDGIVSGVLVERDRCLLLRYVGEEVLPLWREGYSYERGSLIDAAGEVVARTGEPLWGGGGYYDSSHWGFVEEMIEQPVPPRCRPEGVDPALIYDVKPGTPP